MLQGAIFPEHGASAPGDSYSMLRNLTADQQNAAAFLVVVIGVFGQVEFLGWIAERKWVSPTISRKFTHIGVGSVMLTAMSLFPAGNSFPGRIAITTFLFCFMFAFATVAHMTDEQIAALPRPVIARIKRLQSSCARTGSRKELMGGTFLYCAVLSQFVLSSWTSPLNIMTMSALFLGDGLADPIGRKLGGSAQYRILNFGTKSVPGSTACFLASLAGSIMWGRLFVWAGHWGPSTGFDEGNYIFSASWCALAATVGEAISPPEADNIVLCLFCQLAGHILAGRDGFAFLLQTLG